MRRLTTILLAVLVVASATAGASTVAFDNAYEGSYGPGAVEMASFSPFGPSAGDAVVRYGASQTPGVFVTYANDSFKSLESWANTSADRRILEHDADDQRALVTAPGGQLGLTPVAKLLGRGLATKNYVTHVSLNLNLQHAEPVTLESSEAYERPTSNALVRGQWSPDGVAFAEDAPRATPADVKTVVGADGVTQDGTGVRLGICDTGVNTDEGTVFGNGTRNSPTRIDAARNFVTDQDASAANGFENVSDGNGHGTWVASAAAANATGTTYDGMAPNATLVVGKALNDEGKASTDQIAACVEYMEQQEVDVLSLSVGSPIYSPVLAEELDQFLTGNGTVALVAAGNSRLRPAGGRYVNSPADTPADGVLAIAATTANESKNAEAAYFSSVGPDGARDLSNGVTAGQEVALAAPGMNTTARTISQSGYHSNTTLSGTSMSTPYVAGSAALFLDANPEYVGDANATAGYLQNTTTTMPNAGVTEVGQGMVNVSQLVATTGSNETQSQARNQQATARDDANRAYSGAWWLHLLSLGA